MIALERLKERLHYDPETGLFTWLTGYHASKIGTVAGTLREGYVQIVIDGTAYLAHRLAWLYVYGSVPPMIDHKDTVRSHNWISNLRECTNSQNQGNRGATKTSSLGVKGVLYRKDRGKYEARIFKAGTFYNLGHYDTCEEAKARYDREAEKHYGEFARA